ncbi:MAG: RHS repeat-associated core domain-containing protein, partial [Gracilibacteraceae bacterium]|nr:RHS repeat-associated core domain-containing protein [Gracilibacteraceae bacterium]
SYFSDPDVGHRFEEPQEIGVTSILYYDAADRLFRTDMPDGTFSFVEFSPWYSAEYDANDTVLESSWFEAQDPPDPKLPLPQNIVTGALSVTAPQRAVWLAAQHADTPAVTVLDSLGREVFTIAHNVTPTDDGGTVSEKHLSYIKLDAEGKPLWVRDARNNLVMQYIRPNFDVPLSEINRWEPTDYTPAYDIAGNLLFEHSMDAGDKWMLFDAAGNIMVAWQGSDVFMTCYDMLRRPVEQWLTADSGNSLMTERLIYGESLGEADERNLRGQPYRHFDQSGVITFAGYDFKGNLTEQRRQLALEYKEPVDWQEGSVTAGLEAEVFVQIMEYDALNNVSRLYHWHRQAIGDGNMITVSEPVYNQRNLLESVVLWQDAVKTTDGYAEGTATKRLTPIVGITYDAKGQRQSLAYGNGSMTRYYYDPLTFRLRQLRTTRLDYDPAFPGNPAPLADDRVLQDLHYTYDPVGNITEICDQAFETAFFKNQQVEPRNLFVYDALYRLISATGREDMLTAHEAPGQFERDIYPLLFPHEDKALANYRQNYSYDAEGNMLQMRHHSLGGGWTKEFAYAVDSNRLLTSHQGNTDAISYRYDSRGNMLNLANTVDGFDLRWNYLDMLSHVNRGGGGLVHYTYDSGKTRTRKVAVNRAGKKQWERIYLGDFEIYRKYNGEDIVEEIETLHLMDGNTRFLQIENVIQTDNPRLDTGVLLRYQYSNHLGSAVLELDDKAKIISYEEYHPFGTSAYRAMNSDIRAAANRYRYTGKERDEESGLYYHGARYYAPWLMRWVSCDPIGISVENYGAKKTEDDQPASEVTQSGEYMASSHDTPSVQENSVRDELNLYVYCLNKPLLFTDPNGETSYIFYDPNLDKKGNGEAIAKEMREMLKKQFGSDVKLIKLTTFKAFKKEWATMESVDFVGILAHGDNLHIYFPGEKIASKRLTELSAKDIPIIFTTICNAAMDYPATDKKTIANAFLGVEGVRSVVAADGYADFEVAKWYENNVEFNASDKKPSDSPYQNGYAPKGYVHLTGDGGGKIERNILYNLNELFNVSQLIEKLRTQGLLPDKKIKETAEIQSDTPLTSGALPVIKPLTMTPPQIEIKLRIKPPQIKRKTHR